MSESGKKLSALILADTTVEPVGRFMADGAVPPVLRARFGPLGQVQQVLSDAAHAAWSPMAEVLVVWTTPERAIPSFAALLEYEAVELDKILAEVDGFSRMVAGAIGRAAHTYVVSWSLPPHERWVQSLAWRHETGLANVLARINLRLAENLRDSGAVILDSAHWYAACEGPSFDAKLYALGKIRYSRELFLKAAAEIKAVTAGRLGRARKLVVCDLDNTLWGGVVGDDGLDGIVLGGVDAVGESHQELQRALKNLARRGVLLAICSRNDEAVALGAIDTHPEMLLRRDDFAAWRINWGDKAANLAELTRELGLGLESVVFLDDNPVERDRVRQALPEVLVPELPPDCTRWPALVRSLDCFETPEITAADRSRARMYHQEGMRREDRSAAASLDEWLRSLEVTVTAAPLDRANLARAAQLLNRTNQFNLATRRMSGKELWQWAGEEGHQVWTFRVADRFGDQGLSGLAAVSCREGEAQLAQFVMSCRVLGKGAEEAVLAEAVARAIAAGATAVRAVFRPTERNAPLWEFLRGKYADAASWLLDMRAIRRPEHVRVLVEEAVHG